MAGIRLCAGGPVHVSPPAHGGRAAPAVSLRRSIRPALDPSHAHRPGELRRRARRAICARPARRGSPRGAGAADHGAQLRAGPALARAATGVGARPLRAPGRRAHRAERGPGCSRIRRGRARGAGADLRDRRLGARSNGAARQGLSGGSADRRCERSPPRVRAGRPRPQPALCHIRGSDRGRRPGWRRVLHRRRPHRALRPELVGALRARVRDAALSRPAQLGRGRLRVRDPRAVAAPGAAHPPAQRVERARGAHAARILPLPSALGAEHRVLRRAAGHDGGRILLDDEPGVRSSHRAALRDLRPRHQPAGVPGRNLDRAALVVRSRGVARGQEPRGPGHIGRRLGSIFGQGHGCELRRDSGERLERGRDQHLPDSREERQRVQFVPSVRQRRARLFRSSVLEALPRHPGLSPVQQRQRVGRLRDLRDRLQRFGSSARLRRDRLERHTQAERRAQGVRGGRIRRSIPGQRRPRRAAPLRGFRHAGDAGIHGLRPRRPGGAHEPLRRAGIDSTAACRGRLSADRARGLPERRGPARDPARRAGAQRRARPARGGERRLQRRAQVAVGHQALHPLRLRQLEHALRAPGRRRQRGPAALRGHIERGLGPGPAHPEPGARQRRRGVLQ